MVVCLVIGFKVNDMLTLEASAGYMKAEYDTTRQQR